MPSADIREPPLVSLRSKFWRRAAVVALLAAIVCCVALLPVREQVERFVMWLRGAGVWGPLALIAVYVLATLVFLPGSLLTIGAGFVFGVPTGFVAVSAGSVIGASLAFLLSRTLLRGLIAERVARSPRFRAVDQAVRRQGFRIVLLVRLSPFLPFAFLNYFLGLTSVRFRDFLLASWLGMAPGTLMYVYLGSVAGMLVLEGPRRPAEIAFLIFGLVATIVATVFIARLARNALREAMPQTSRSTQSLDG